MFLQYLELIRGLNPVIERCLETYAYLKSIDIDSEADTDYVYMDISNLIIYLILNKTILWLRCLHELPLE